MPIREDLLMPIPGDQPSGKSLRYERVYDQIKEARIEEDDTLPAGAWERAAKRADYRLVMKLSTEALTTTSKDLQLAAWLGEAHIKVEGAEQIAPVLQLLLRLQDTFWDTLYPQVEDGDTGLRGVPLQWAANRYASLVYSLPLTRNNIDFVTYRAARALGSEADVAGNEGRRTARAEAISRGQVTTEEVDQAIAESPKSLYVSLEQALRESLDRLEELAAFCEDRYGDDAPSFRKLRESLEEVHNFARTQLNEKRRLEPDPIPAGEALVVGKPSAPLSAISPPVAANPSVPTQAASPIPAVPALRTSGASQSWEEAEATVVAMAKHMASERPGSAVPYLIHTSIRWGELRREMPKPPRLMLASPLPEDRTFLKLAASENRWSDVLDRAMTLMSEPVGRAWMDLHRYIWEAATEMGFIAFAEMVVRSVQGMLIDFQELPNWTLADDSPAADASTQLWLDNIVHGETDESHASLPGGTAADGIATALTAPQSLPIFAPMASLRISEDGRSSDAQDRADGDLFGRALELARSGQLREATQLLVRDAAAQPTGRLRFRRRLQLAQFCVAIGSGAIAVPVLRELIAEVDYRKLDTWEECDMITQPIALMLQCMSRPEDAGERERLFAKLCGIDASAALEIQP